MLTHRRIVAWAAVALFVAAVAAAATQPLLPDPHAARKGLDWWTYPLETNAPWRLPTISASLQDLAMLRDDAGKIRLWAVGDNGAIVYSGDGGRCWQAQGPWKPAEAARVCSPANLLDHQRRQAEPFLAGVIPTAQAATPAEQETIAVTEPRPDRLPRDQVQQTAAASAPPLRPGDKSDAVVQVREALSDAGISPAVETAPEVFDQALAEAVRQFQRDAGLVPDGIVGPGTWQALRDGAIAEASGKAVEPGLDGNTTGLASASGALESEKAVEPRIATQPLEPPPAPDLEAVHFIDAGDGSLRGWAVGDDGTILATADGGASWQAQTSGTDARLFAVQFLADAKTGWAVGSDGTILATADGGASWQAQTSGTDATLYAVQFLADAKTGWAVGTGGTILATADGGASWQAQTSDTDARLFAVQFLADAKTGWAVGEDGTILATADGGNTWASPLAPYAVAPAPWFWLATAFCITLLGFTFVPQPPQVNERRVADLLASDRPLRSPHETDALDLGGIAASLSEFLRNRSTEAPLTIAVTGDWGSGKTSLMNLLRQDLADNYFRPVWFNAWHHQKGEQILASLFAQIREQSIPPLLSVRGLFFRWRLMVRRGAPAWLLVTLLVLAFGISVGYLTDIIGRYGPAAWEILTDPERVWQQDMQAHWGSIAKLFGAAAGIVASALGLMRALQGFGLDPQRLVTVNPQNRKTQGLDPGARSRFQREFRDVTECLKPRKMVIFIDDLDRCGKDSLIEVLEAVNFLASSGDCFIVLGMSPRWVESCVGLAYEDLAEAMAAEYPDNGDTDTVAEQSAEQRRHFAKNYLEKLINIDVPIPALQQKQAALLFGSAEPTAASEGAPAKGGSGWRTWPGRAFRMLMDLLKPALIVGALGYGLYAGFDLLHRPVEPPIPQRVHWSSGEVRIDAPAPIAGHEGAASSDQVESGGTRTQVPDAKPSSGTPAKGRLAQSLSELLGVEISIQANEQALQDELVLFEGGTDDKRWRVVLSEPEEQQPTPEPEKSAQPAPVPPGTDAQPTRDREFRLLPGLESKPSWQSAILPLLVVALALTAWQSSRREAEGITEDSSDFREALATWLPWLMARQGTPRAVKRFVNKLRYIAIRLRAGAGNTAGFPEPNTVALAAIGFLDEDWLMDDGDYERVVQNRLDELLRPGAGPAANLGQQATVDVTNQLADCIARHADAGSGAGDKQPKADRPYPWPPTPEHRAALLAILAQQSRS